MMMIIMLKTATHTHTHLTPNPIQFVCAHPRDSFTGTNGFGTKKVFIFIDKATRQEITPQATNGTTLTKDAQARPHVDHEGLPNEIERRDNRTTQHVPKQTGIARKDLMTSWHGCCRCCRRRCKSWITLVLPLPSVSSRRERYEKNGGSTFRDKGNDWKAS